MNVARLIVGAALALALAGCGSAAIPTGAPHNADAAQQLVSTVASDASCGALEYVGESTPKTWTFSCQLADETFDISAFETRSAQTAWTDRLTSENITYLSMPHYTVAVADAGSITAQSSLAPFRKSTR